MSSISAILKQGKVKRFKKNMADSMTTQEQFKQFLTTNGDVHILPFLNKFEKS